MTTTDLSAAIRKLSVEQRLELIGDIWDSLDEVPIPSWQLAELDRRRAEHLQDPGSAIPWDEANEWLRSRHG